MEERFLDYLENKLSAADKARFEEALASDPRLKKAFESYKELIQTESDLKSTSYTLNANFAAKVMESIDNRETGFFRRLFMDITINTRSISKVLASLGAVIFVVQLYRVMPDRAFHDPEAVKAPGPVEAIPLEDNKPAKPELKPNALTEPEKDDGSVKIRLDNKSSIEGSIQAGAQVDVIWSTKANGKPAVAVIAENARVKKIDKAPDGTPEISLDTGASDKKKIELATRTGEISLSLRGANDMGSTAPLTIQDLSPTMMLQEHEKKFDSRQLPASAPAGLSRNVLSARGPVPADMDAWHYHQTGPVDREGYNSYSENPRIEVRSEPSSTFGVDVDTASYTNARRYIRMGSLPPADSVRVEEFLNYFDYSYPKQYEKPFALYYEVAPSPLQKDRYLLKLGIKARDLKESTKPWNVVFLVDVSGSMMDQNKLPLVQRSLRLLTENMRAGDKVGIVTYAGSAGTLLEPTTIKEKEKILAAIDRLSAGGSTNGSGGIRAAYELAERNKIEDAVNRVVLASDGDFNVGVTSQSELIKLIEEKRKSGVTLTTLGFGTGNLQDGTMEQLANKGNGNYYYIDSFQEARKVLEKDLAGTMEVVAKDVKLQIEFNPEHVQSYRLIGYENRKLRREDFNNDAIDAGEIGSGHTVTALYELVLTGSELSKKLNDEYRYQEKDQAKQDKTKEASENKKELSSELAFLKIRYKDPEASESKLLSFPIEKANLQESGSSDFNFASAVSYFAHKLRGSQYAGEYSYKEIAELAEKSKGDDSHGYRREFIELVKDTASIK